MPASSAEVIGAALQSAYQHKPADSAPPVKKKAAVEDQLIASSKQVLLNHVEYDGVGTQHSLVLTSLKSKYVNLTASATTTPTSPSGSMAQAHHKQASSGKEDQLEEPRVILWSKDKVTLGWRKPLPPGAGMVNMGNTCYMNSSLQALFHIPAMTNWLMEDFNNHTQRCENNATSASFCSVCAMMRTFRCTLDRSSNVIKPSLIHQKLKSIGKTLMYGRQEDAHEFIKLLLDHMEKSYLMFKRATKLDHRSKETTPLNQIFGGYLRQQVICPVCHHVSTTFSHFQDLVLDIRSVTSVEEALNLHFRKETLDSDNAYKCERCHKKVPATKRHLIERAPNVLLIQLKRFTFSGGKIGKHINIQRTIDISRFVSGSAKQQPGGGGSGVYQYRLASMVIHLGGSQHGGHYTAVAEASSGTMYEYDDASVRSISVQSALLRNPYILFYEMVRKSKDPAHSKQVVRQSSEKALIRQNSDGVCKPIPTSHSASSVANGYGRISENIGETVVRSSIQSNTGKSSIPPPKDREKISFGLKFSHNQGSSKGDYSNKPNKIILNPGTTSLLAVKPSVSSSSSSLAKFSGSSSAPKSSVSSSATKLSSSSGVSSSVAKASASSGSSSVSRPLVSLSGTTSSPSSSRRIASISKNVPSLVPYLDDSEDSEVEDSKKLTASENREKQVSNSKLKSTEIQKNGKETNMECVRSERMNGVLSNQKHDKICNGEVKNAGSESTGKSNSNPSKVGPTLPLLPRTLQVSNCVSQHHSKQNAEVGWLVTDASLHSPSESSSSSAGGSHASRFTVIDQPTSNKIDLKEPPQGREKIENQGWTITIRKSRPELEKSHSHDSVLPGPGRKKDESDSASLKSKASIDSSRSDRSTKSVKKSIFSLFTCVSSSRSPDSPESEDTEASHAHNNDINGICTDKSSDIETKACCTTRSNTDLVKCKSKKEVLLSDIPRNGIANGKNSPNPLPDSDSDSELSQSKRVRDHDDNEPSSPSKKCRPEVKTKTCKKSDSEASKSSFSNSTSKNGLSPCEKSKNSLYNDSDCSKNGVKNESEKSKNGIAKYISEEKQVNSISGNNSISSEALVRPNDSSSVSVSSLSGSSSESESSESEKQKEVTEKWVEKTKETIGKAKTNPDAHIVHWNGNLKDLSHENERASEEDANKKKLAVNDRRKNGMWDGSRSTEVVDELRRAGNLAYGTKVNSWGGGRSWADQHYEKERKEVKKRTADDLYNEEFDSGRVKKMKSKKSWDGPQRWDRNSGNEFQKLQDFRNSGSWGPHNYHNNIHSNQYTNYHSSNQYSRDEYYDRNRNRYYQRNKHWKTFDNRDHKFHKKHKDKYKHWNRRN